MYPKDIDDIFNMIDKLFNEDYRGGYMRTTSSSKNDYGEEKQFSDGYMDKFTDKDNVYFTIDLTPMEEENVEVSVTRTHITISLLIDGNSHSKSYKLPVPVIPKSMKKTFVNSIMDITLAKAETKVIEDG